MHLILEAEKTALTKLNYELMNRVFSLEHPEKK